MKQRDGETKWTNEVRKNRNWTRRIGKRGIISGDGEIFFHHPLARNNCDDDNDDGMIADLELDRISTTAVANPISLLPSTKLSSIRRRSHADSLNECTSSIQP